MHVKTVYGGTLPDSQLEGSLQLSDPPDNHLVCSCGPLTYPTCPQKSALVFFGTTKAIKGPVGKMKSRKTGKTGKLTR